MVSPPSPAASVGSAASQASYHLDDHHPLTLDDLIKHFVGSKRSLNTQTVLQRAAELVSTARDLLQENAYLAAKNAAVRNIVDQQVETLGLLRSGVHIVEAEIEAEFKQLLHHVDTAFAGLNATLAVLRDTPIEAALQPSDAPQKHLYDFIDNTTVSELESSLRACIDRYNDAHATLDDSSDAFDTTLDNLYSSIAHVPIPPITPGEPSPIPRLYHQLEEHANEAAQAFQSLVQHYDLCVTALRYTEGGSAAAMQAIGDEPVLSTHDFTTSLEPISEEERREMLNVLSKDAHEVSQVVNEIRDRGSEMTVLVEKMENHVHQLRNETSALWSILKMMARIATEAELYITTSRSFQASWSDDTRPTLLTGTEDWDNQREFYERFDLAYAQLLVEISARRRRHEKAKRKAEEAQKELDRLRVEDERAREQFAHAQGDFLPLDIWPALREKPRRYEVKVVATPRTNIGEVPNEEEDESVENGPEAGGIQSIPQLSRNVIERALTKVKGRM